jgi:uncharacterized protein (TIGR02118 family)
MVKMIAMVKKKDELTIEEFAQYWYQKHAPLARKLVPESVTAGWKKYLQNYAMSLNGETHAPYDGVAELYFADLPAFWKWNDWYFSEDGKVLRDDEDNFMNRSQTVVIITEEKVVIGDQTS